MREEEAEYIHSILDGLVASEISPCVNLGSSTAVYRDKIKPHISQVLFDPLVKKNVRLIHVDLKNDVGVDIAGNIFNKELQAKIHRQSAKLVMCCNMFEHIEDKVLLAEIIDSFLVECGYLLVSVPYSYPLHYDPIDTYFRPTPDDICDMFPGYDLVNENIILSNSYLMDILKSQNKLSQLLKLFKKMITILNPFYSKKEWLRRHHRLKWLVKRYKVTVVLLRKVTG